MSESEKKILTQLEDRENFGSNFGLIMTTIGVAVGLGNVWRFPYMVGKFGGGAFVLLYIVIVLAFGVPALMAEYTLGRYTRRGPVGAFPKIGMPGGKFFGWLLFITVFMATSYYTVVIGWVLYYMGSSLLGSYVGKNTGDFFNSTLANVPMQFITTAVIIIAIVVVLIYGVQKGIERVSKIAMPALFVMLIILIIRAVTLPGAAEGVKFYFMPDFSKINASTVLGALGQAFFSLSLGGTFMMCYASYMSKKEDIPKAALLTAIGDSTAGILAGLVIVPAAIAVGLEVTSGPSLTFITAPAIFQKMPGGMIFAFMFFLLLLLAAYLSDVAAFEVLVATLVDEFNWDRKKALIIFGIAELIIAIPSMISVDFLSKNDLIWGSTMQPLGSAITMIALAWFVGKGKALEEINQGASKPVNPFFIFWIKWVVPIGIFLILALGLKDLVAQFLG